MSTTLTPASVLATTRQVKASKFVQAALGAAAIALVIFRTQPGPSASLISALVVGEFLTAYLLMGQAIRKRCPALLMLAGAFVSSLAGFNAAPAALSLLGLPPPASFMAGAFAARTLFSAWFLAYAFLENYCNTRAFTASQFVVRATGILAICVVSPFLIAGALVPVAMRGISLDQGPWLAGSLVLSAAALIVFWRRTTPSVTNLALRVSLQCALIDLCLVALSPANSLGLFGAQCFGLVACTILPAVFLVEFNGMYAQLASESDVFRNQAMRDALTGVGNRRAYEALMHSRVAALARGESSKLGLLVVDVDNFKAFNDTFGHEAGDRCLARIAKAIELGVARSDDSVFRYGGEEFAVVLSFTEIDGLRYVAERIRNTVWNLAIPHPFTPFRRVTVSIGIAVAPSQGASAIELFNEADRALYQAKHSGRNCTTMQQVS